MNDKDTKLAAVRAAQSDIHDAVNKLRNERGLSFQSAWSTLEQTLRFVQESGQSER